ncbi:hypothetical protein PAPHI01_1674 [Pancytospora philotis]|nr:hypothetical protein PAPHI01_1674 [Pancytospora philotis]
MQIKHTQQCRQQSAKFFAQMGRNAGKYRDPEDLTDSETEVHPNIDARSFHRFMKEERSRRLEELRGKTARDPREEKELAKLEYQMLPVDSEVKEDSFFCVASSTEPKEVDYSDDLIAILNDPSLGAFIAVLDGRSIDLSAFEEYILFNLSEAIKDGDDELGFSLCRLGLLVKWAHEYGRAYILTLQSSGEQKLSEYYQTHYQLSKDAILSMGAGGAAN